MLEEIRDYAYFLFHRSAVLYSILLLGLLSKNYKSLANKKIPNKESQVIILATNPLAMRHSREYCSLLKRTLGKMAAKLWDEGAGFYTPPAFRVIAVRDCGPLGAALLGLHDE